MSMLHGMKRALAVCVCAALAASGCATSGSMRVSRAYAAPDGSASRAVLTEYLQKLQPGMTVKIVRAQGRPVRGTLMKATDDTVFLQPATRRPEPILEVPISNVLSVTPETRKGGNQIGRAIGAGAAAGAGAALAIFLVIVAAFGD